MTDNENDLDTLPPHIQLFMRHADKFFEGTQTKEQLFELMRMSFSTLSDMFQSLNARGVITAEEAGMYQWAAGVCPCILRVLEAGPKYGPELEQQLKDALRHGLRYGKRGTVTVDIPECIRAPGPNTVQ